MIDDLGPAAGYCWLGLPRSKPNSAVELAGAAFLLSSELAVTCAHVVRDHLGLNASPAAAPDLPITLRFEALDIEVKALVAQEGWHPDGAGGPAVRLRDVAFLRLRTPVEAAGLRYHALAPWVPRGGRSALVIGAEPGYQGMSQNVPVKIAENPNNRGLWQLDATSSVGFAVVRGFSGAPVLDEAGTVVWGMVAEVDAKGRPVAFAVGADRLYEARQSLQQGASSGPSEITSQHDSAVPDEMRKLQEQVLRAYKERDAARTELELLQKRLGVTA